jgi:hypothetical protein
VAAYESLPSGPATLTPTMEEAQSRPHLGRHPTSIPQCQHCQTINVMTITRTYPSMETWLMVLGVVLIFWPAFWIPLVINSAKKTDHNCKQCGELVGQVKPLSDCCIEERG